MAHASPIGLSQFFDDRIIDCAKGIDGRSVERVADVQPPGHGCPGVDVHGVKQVDSPDHTDELKWRTGVVTTAELERRNEDRPIGVVQKDDRALFDAELAELFGAKSWILARLLHRVFTCLACSLLGLPVVEDAPLELIGLGRQSDFLP